MRDIFAVAACIVAVLTGCALTTTGTDEGTGGAGNGSATSTTGTGGENTTTSSSSTAGSSGTGSTTSTSSSTSSTGTGSTGSTGSTTSTSSSSSTSASSSSTGGPLMGPCGLIDPTVEWVVCAYGVPQPVPGNTGLAGGVTHTGTNGTIEQVWKSALCVNPDASANWVNCPLGSIPSGESMQFQAGVHSGPSGGPALGGAGCDAAFCGYRVIIYRFGASYAEMNIVGGANTFIGGLSNKPHYQAPFNLDQFFQIP